MRKLGLRILVALALIPFVWYVYDRGARRGNDFKYPYGASRLLLTSGELRVDSQPRYPITYHVMLLPLAGLPIGRAAAIFAVLSVAAMWTLPRLLEKLSGVEPRRQIWAWAYAAPFFVDAMILGQSDPINFALVVAGLVAAGAGRGFVGALLIGIAGMIKFLPAAHWATLLARRRSPGVWAGIVATLIIGFALVASTVGWSRAIKGFREQADWISNNERPWHLVARGGDLRPNNESLPIVLARTFGDIPEAHRPARVVVLARLPLGIIWWTWAAIVALMAVAWLATIGPAARIEPRRGWLGMFALSSILMLAATPICWHHYFLWTLPAALFLADRRRLLIALAIISPLATAFDVTRGLGSHMILSLGLFALVVREIRRSATADQPIVRPTRQGLP